MRVLQSKTPPPPKKKKGGALVLDPPLLTLLKIIRRCVYMDVALDSQTENECFLRSFTFSK